jgi:hypothetical protein
VEDLSMRRRFLYSASLLVALVPVIAACAAYSASLAR